MSTVGLDEHTFKYECYCVNKLLTDTANAYSGEDK